MRFGPKFRQLGASMIEECGQLWQLYEATRGYQIQKYNELSDHLTMLVSGSLQMTIPSKYFQTEVDPSKKHVVFGDLKVGDFVGEQGVIDQARAPWTIEVTSDKAKLYRIHRANFLQYFGGPNGAPYRHLQSVIQMKRKWDQMKWDKIQSLSASAFSS